MNNGQHDIEHPKGSLMDGSVMCVSNDDGMLEYLTNRLVVNFRSEWITEVTKRRSKNLFRSRLMPYGGRGFLLVACSL